MYLSIPEHVAIQLRLEPLHQREVTLANGAKQLCPYVGPVCVRFQDRACFTGALILGDEVLMGAIPMEDMDLCIYDPNRTGFPRAMDSDARSIETEGKIHRSQVIADEPRHGDLDGRGNLSDAGLAGFCLFFLTTALDQVRFMSSLLGLPGLSRRLTQYVERRSASGVPEEAKYILIETLLHGEIARGEVPRITGKPERSARRILEQTLKQGLVAPTTAKSPIRLALPAKAVPYNFPSLYPEGVETAILEESEEHDAEKNRR